MFKEEYEVTSGQPGTGMTTNDRGSALRIRDHANDVQGGAWHTAFARNRNGDWIPMTAGGVPQGVLIDSHGSDHGLLVEVEDGGEYVMVKQWFEGDSCFDREGFPCEDSHPNAGIVSIRTNVSNALCGEFHQQGHKPPQGANSFEPTVQNIIDCALRYLAHWGGTETMLGWCVDHWPCEHFDIIEGEPDTHCLKCTNPHNRDVFTTAYIEAMLFAELDTSSSEDVECPPLDANYNVTDLPPVTMHKIIADCLKFQRDWREQIDGDESQAGHDFWFTRQGHGAGFWDGDWPTELGEAMTKASEAFGELCVSIGGDGKLYLE